MYGAEVEKILKGKGISIGDNVKVKWRNSAFEGQLMPRPDVGDENVIVLKMKNGYNTGFKTLEIELIEKQKTTEKPSKTETKSNLPQISIIATGGTISSKVDYKTGGVHMLMNAEEIISTAPQLKNFVSIKKILNPFTIGSEDISFREWTKLAEITAKQANESEGVVILHGTDTMHYTSSALSFMLTNLSKPVVLVGAQRSQDRPSRDGVMNLTCASIFSTSNHAGVSIVMHGTSNDDYCIAIPGTKARKMHTSRRDAFRPINAKPRAFIFPDGRVEFKDEVKKRSSEEVKADTSYNPKVGLIKVHPGSNPEIIDFFISKNYKGLIIEGTGLGHVPTQTLKKEDSWIDWIKKASKEMIVGITSQCIYGRTNPNVYSNLRLLNKTGAIHCEDMLSETALIKLSFLLGHDYERKEIEKKMLENTAGEINKRITISEFLN
ncbi:MAG: Glu-tRNA(Gln) amidotransferase subunit GatD [Candidatus Marsarchaeota archaeon]|nr:Glu-tRNA(Gln) amidotransferase subunit GatD [Candidatus Marsarchaeota archaeon]